jgi:hypothetical protein
MTHDDAARDGGAMLSYGGDLTSARETTGKAWQGSPARGRRRGTTRRRRWRRDAVSVDVGGHGGDGSDRATAASDSGGRDGGARGEAGRAAVGTPLRGLDSAFNALKRCGAWQPRGKWRAVRRAQCSARRLTGGTHSSAFSELKITPDENSSK